MPDRQSIVGISRTSLWRSWKLIRKKLKKAIPRDIVDYLDFDIDPDDWINRLLEAIETNSYEPDQAKRFSFAKGKGFRRTITYPTISDLVLFHAIADFLYGRKREDENENVYFDQKELSEVREDAVEEARKFQKAVAEDYRLSDLNTFLAWLNYNEYRKRLIFENVFNYFVVTDVTNYFDSILHVKLVEVFHDISAPPRMLGLFHLLLERLARRGDYGPMPGIGIPVDEFDCSRRIAHVFLFQHDDRMVDLVGEDAYVRWMDDQIFGADSYADALRIVGEVDDSLATLHLTANASKTHILTLNEAREYYHLDLNTSLDEIQDAIKDETVSKDECLEKMAGLWPEIEEAEGVGEWDKILSRTYRLAGTLGWDRLRPRALDDLIRYPTLATRIAAYYRCTGSASDFIDFAQSAWNLDEQIYPDVNLRLFEEFLRLEPEVDGARVLRRFAREVLDGDLDLLGSEMCSSVAPLLTLRYGDKRSLPTLEKAYKAQWHSLPPLAVRAASIVSASYGRAEAHDVRVEAGKLRINPLAEAMYLVDAIQDYTEIPGRYRRRLTLHWDSVRRTRYVDMRKLLCARLLRLNRRKSVNDYADELGERWRGASVSDYDRDLIQRLLL